ncbi:MAG: LL-diaminopimelate aminotransferase [Alphaproteobacteria bacterium]|nr:LL-diaminopimelate aminotransferase [Alphaproteobacteria bacterium]
MVAINTGYLDLVPNYLFKDIADKVKALKAANPEAEVISLGIGDVTQPLPDACVKAMQKAAAEMGSAETMRGYGPDFGYAFLRQAIQKNDYADWGIDVAEDEIFVSDGSKCDISNIQEIFAADAKVGITNPVYPVYRDSNIMAGRKITFLPCREENGFIPEIPKEKLDIVYLCSPNNPTGTAFTKEELAKWVAYAKENQAVIIFDAAYKEYITDASLPKSIYEIAGAKEVAIESRSFSKTAGFTGLRCGYMVVPKELKGFTPAGEEISLNQLWGRRMATKFNGVSYVTQRAAEAIFSPEGKKEVAETIRYYMDNAKILKQALEDMGYKVFGGENAPYLWFKVKNGSSEEFFARLLNQAFLVCTPGNGFGSEGEGYIRFTAFGTRENTQKAIERLQKVVL